MFSYFCLSSLLICIIVIIGDRPMPIEFIDIIVIIGDMPTGLYYKFCLSSSLICITVN